MKKTIIIAAILLLAVGCNRANKTSTTDTTNQSNNTNWQTYRNTSYNFEFQYPPDFSFQTPTYGSLSDQVVQIAPSQNDYPGTNYVDSAVTVSAGFAKDTGQCLVSQSDKRPLTESKIINGVTFYKDAAVGAGAGNLYTSTIYRTLNKTWCTEIVLTVHTGNIGNYPEGTVTELDQNKPMAVLLQMLDTFKFTK